MGAFKVEMEIGDLDGKRYVPFTGLVIERCLYTEVPGSLLASLGVEPTSTRAFKHSDGSIVEKPLGYAGLRYGGKETQVPVIFCEDDEEPLIGETTLEWLALEADLENERLTRLRLRL